MDDMRAVLDAAGSDARGRVRLARGRRHGRPLRGHIPRADAMRSSSSSSIRTHAAEHRPAQLAELADLRESWGTRQFSDELLAVDLPDALCAARPTRLVRELARVGASPERRLRAQHGLLRRRDLREVLPTIRVPTLVLVRGEPGGRISRASARLIPGRAARRARGLRLLGDVPFARDRRRARGVRGHGGRRERPDTVLATILFTDLVGSTAKAAELGDRRWRELLAEHHARTAASSLAHRGVELDTAGDGFFARFDAPARAIRCACAIRDSVAELGLDLRVGLHTGECEVLDDKVAGIAVSIGARVAAEAEAGEVLVSQTVKDLVAGSGLAFDERGVTTLRGVRARGGCMRWPTRLR